MMINIYNTPQMQIAKPTLPDNYSEDTYVKLEEAVIAIQLSKPIKYSLEELYQAVVNMCSHKMDAQLYAKLKELTELHVKRNIKLKELTGGSIDKLVITFILILKINNFNENKLNFIYILYRFYWRKSTTGGCHSANR